MTNQSQNVNTLLYGTEDASYKAAGELTGITKLVEPGEFFIRRLNIVSPKKQLIRKPTQTRS